MSKTILAVFHDNNLASGATKSFLSNIEYLKNSGDKIIALIPKKEGDLSEYLSNLGIEVHHATYGGNVFANSDNILTILKNYFRCLIKSIISYISSYQLSEIVKNRSIDCVYSNTSTIYMGAWIAQKLKVNHFWHFREFCLEDQNSRRIWERGFVKLGRNASKIFTISNTIDEYYVSKYGFKNTVMVYNDISDSYINTKKINHEGINILITGTICKEKGQEYAIKAIRELNNSLIHLYIAGRINKYAKALMKDLNRDSVVNITFCGLVKDMRELRSNMDISLVCARREAFGRTIIEDMLSGIVVIGCDTGAVTELVKDDFTGYVYEYGDVEELKEVIIRAVQDNDKLEKIRENAFKFATKFTKNTTAQRIRGIIDEID